MQNSVTPVVLHGAARRHAVFMKRLLVPLIVGLVLLLAIHSPITAQDAPTFPIRINAGGDQPYTDQNGHIYLPDQEWTPQTPVGYVGGRRMGYGFWQYIDATPEEELHKRQRLGWEAYRFGNIPNGDYLVTLSFSMIGPHPDPVFSVDIEGQTVLDSLNITALVGRNYALNRRFAAHVTDGELDVVATPITGDPRLSAIIVEPRVPDTVAPAVPAELATISSYNAVLLDWADTAADNLDGYHVYRAASPDGPYSRLTTEPVYISRYQNTVTATHVTYYYRISAIDVYGNESDLSADVAGVALAESDATLPLYQLQVPQANLRFLAGDPLTSEEVTGI